MLPRAKARKSTPPLSFPAAGTDWTIEQALLHYDVQRWTCGLSFHEWLLEAIAAGVKMEWSR